METSNHMAAVVLGAAILAASHSPPFVDNVSAGSMHPVWRLPIADIAPMPPPPPAPSSPTGYGGMGGGCSSGSVHDLIVSAFAADQVGTALAIADRESGCNPTAWNPTAIEPYG